MKQKTIIFSVASLVIALISLAMIGISYGWFTHQVTLSSGEIASGDLRYTQTGAFISSSGVIVPGEELILTDFEVTNNSTITSQLRFIISYTRVTSPVLTETIYYSGSVDDHISVTKNASFVYASNYWYYTASDYEIAAASGLMSVITSLYYDGYKTGIDYIGVVLTITITIEVKQADNVNWATLATYDFETGYPA